MYALQHEVLAAQGIPGAGHRTPGLPIVTWRGLQTPEPM